MPVRHLSQWEAGQNQQLQWRDSILRFGSAKRDLCKNPVVLLAILVEKPDAAKSSITLHCLDRHPRPARVQLNHVTWLES
jgi:hypothetical protein